MMNIDPTHTPFDVNEAMQLLSIDKRHYHVARDSGILSMSIQCCSRSHSKFQFHSFFDLLSYTLEPLRLERSREEEQIDFDGMYDHICDLMTGEVCDSNDLASVGRLDLFLDQLEPCTQRERDLAAKIVLRWCEIGYAASQLITCHQHRSLAFQDTRHASKFNPA